MLLSAQAESCSDAYNHLKGYYGNANNATPAITNACASADFQDMARCQQVMADMVQSTLGLTSVEVPQTSFQTTPFRITQSQALITAGGSSTAQYLTMLNQNQSGQANGFVSGIMNPYMIDAYVAYALMLIPCLPCSYPLQCGGKH